VVAKKHPTFDPSVGLEYAPWPQLQGARELWDDDASFGARPRPSVNDRGCLGKVWLPIAEWRCHNIADGADRDAFGMAYLKYRQEARAFLAGELALSIAMTIVQGLAPATREGCQAALWVLFAFNATFLIVCLAMRPFLAPHRNVSLIVVALLTAVGSLLAALSGPGAPVNPGTFAVLTAAQLVLMVATFLATLQKLQRVLEIRAMRTQRAEVEARYKAVHGEASPAHLLPPGEAHDGKPTDSGDEEMAVLRAPLAAVGGAASSVGGDTDSQASLELSSPLLQRPHADDDDLL